MRQIRASAGKVDLCPEVGSWLTGFALRPGPSIGLHDPIMARAVLLDDGENRLALVSCDLLGLAADVVKDLRRRMAERAGVPDSACIVCCTHTHSGPASLPMRGVLANIDQTWLERAKEKIVELVVGLSGQLVPAVVGYGSSTVGGIGYNRQDSGGPIDEELFVVAVRSATGDPLATVVNYATHAVIMGASNLLFSADFPGAACAYLERDLGGVALYTQGACGDIDPVVYRDRGWGTGTFADADQVGRTLAAAAMDVWRDISFADEVRVGSTCEHCTLPLDAPPSLDALNGIRMELEAERRNALDNDLPPGHVFLAEGMLQWCDELAAAVEAGTVPSALTVEIAAAALGDVRIACAPFETYTDIGLAIKNGLAPLRGFYIGYANGLYGYCPSSWAKSQGGYVIDESHRWFSGLLTGLSSGADNMLASRCVAACRALTVG